MNLTVTDVVPPPDKPLIIFPCHGRPHPGTEEMIKILRYKDHWNFQPFYGSLGVDRVRSQAASNALQFENEWFFWCDDDNFAPAEDIRRLWETAKANDFDILAAVVPVRRSNCVPNFTPLVLGTYPLGHDGGIIEAKGCGLAMAFTHRRVFERLAKTLPEVDYTVAYTDEKVKGWPFFLPIVENRNHYGEDYSFCERVRRAGMHLYVDTRLVALHASECVLGIGDIGNYARERMAGEAADEVEYG